MTIKNIHQFLLVGVLHGALYISVSSAQNPIPVNATVSGGGATVETIGSIQMSVGQVFFSNEISPDFNINQGIQQPSVYELVSKVDELSCSGIVLDNKEIYKGEVYNGVMILPYLKGNGAYFLGLNTPSSGVLGLTMSLQSGKLINGNGSIELVLKGTPIDTGIAVFTVAFGTKTCTFNLPVTKLEPKLSVLNCNSIVVNPKDVGSKLDYSGVVTISYQGGNNKKSYPVNIASSVVKGLTLKADSLLLNSSGGVLSFNLTGNPDTAGIAFFLLLLEKKPVMLWLR